MYRERLKRFAALGNRGGVSLYVLGAALYFIPMMQNNKSNGGQSEFHRARSAVHICMLMCDGMSLLFFCNIGAGSPCMKQRETACEQNKPSRPTYVVLDPDWALSACTSASRD